MRKLLFLAVAAMLLPPANARAEEPYFTDANALQPRQEVPALVLAKPTLDAFSYTRPQEKHYFRGALEVSTILIVGNVDYLLNTGARGGTVHAGDRRWDLRYDWPTFRSKLTGDYWRVDTNQFNTNYIGHPYAGTMYYSAARANRLSPLESLAYTTVGALSWEMFGELREEVSINDVIVTSTAGFAIGEPLVQLSSFFYRSKKNFRNDALAALFSPLKAVNDWADDAEHARSADQDRLGFTRDEAHRFEVFGGAGVTKQPSGTYADERFGIDLGIVNLPGYDGVANRRDFFDDGNMADVHFESTLSRGRLADAQFATDIVPLGIYARRGSIDGSGHVYGEGAVLGLLAKFEYSVHDYDRDRKRPLDVLTVLSPAGILAEYSNQRGDLRMRTRLELSGEFAGVTAYALDDYRVQHFYDDTNLQTVLKQQGYYHTLGASASPSIQLGWKTLELGVKGTFDGWRGIEGYDEQQQTISHEIPLSDQRVDLRTWIAARLPRTPLRFQLLARRKLRMGEVGEVRATTGETSIYATGGLVF